MGDYTAGAPDAKIYAKGQVQRTVKVPRTKVFSGALYPEPFNKKANLFRFEEQVYASGRVASLQVFMSAD